MARPDWRMAAPVVVPVGRPLNEVQKEKEMENEKAKDGSGKEKEEPKEGVEKLVEELAALRRQNGVLVEQVAAMGRQNLKLVEEMVAMRRQNGVLEEERKKEREDLNRKIEDLVKTVGFLRKRDEDSSGLEKDGLEQEKKKKKKVAKDEEDFPMAGAGDDTK